MSGKEIVDCPIAEVELGDQVAVGDRTYIVVDIHKYTLSKGPDSDVTIFELTLYTSGYLDRSENLIKANIAEAYGTLTVVRGAETLEGITWQGI